MKRHYLNTSTNTETDRKSVTVMELEQKTMRISESSLFQAGSTCFRQPWSVHKNEENSFPIWCVRLYIWLTFRTVLDPSYPIKAFIHTYIDSCLCKPKAQCVVLILPWRDQAQIGWTCPSFASLSLASDLSSTLSPSLKCHQPEKKY